MRFGEDGGQVAQQAGEVEWRLLEGELAGFDLGQVEDVVDDAQQVPGGGVDLFQALGLFEGGGFPLHDVRHAEDGVHRRADFVAHVGEEGALGPVGGFGGGACVGQLAGALGHQFLEVFAILGQLDFMLHALRDVLDRAAHLHHAPFGVEFNLAQAVHPAFHSVIAADDAIRLVEGFALPQDIVLQIVFHHRPLGRVDQIQPSRH